MKQEHPDFFNNPERGEKEICIANDFAGSDYFDNIPMKTKRKGKVAVNRISGEALDESLGYFPVFVDIKDYLENKKSLVKVLSEMSGMSEQEIRHYSNNDSTSNN